MLSSHMATASVSPIVERLKEIALAPFVELGMIARMLWDSLYWAVRPPYRFRLLIAAMEFIGVGSLFIVSLTGFFTGAVLGLQLVDGFRQFSAENQTGAVVGLAMTREIGPVFTALMVSSRAGSAMASEIGSMREGKQIDALLTMAVNPIQYLVTPRVVAGLLMVPILCLLFNFVGMIGARFVACNMLGVDPGIFMDRFRWLVGMDDLTQGLIKAAVFGVTISVISCRQGFYASGGSAGVGQATNRAVVHCAVAILILDYLVTSIYLGQGL